MGKYFTLTPYFYSPSAHKNILRARKMSFPYCTTSVISDLLLSWYFYSTGYNTVFIDFYSPCVHYLERSVTSVQYGRIQNARMMGKYSSKNIKATINKYIYIYIFSADYDMFTDLNA